MPIFNYKCEKCGATDDNVFHLSIKRIADYYCHKCGGKMVRLIGVSNAHYKGSGFYTTDYKGK